MKYVLATIIAFLRKIPLRVWIEIIVGGTLLTLAIIYLTAYKRSQKELGNARINNTAYRAKLEGAENDIVRFKISMQQLRYYNDSVSKKLTETVNKLKLKDKQVKELQYMYVTFERTDTITMHDTIFLDPEFCFDTVIGDEWMSANLYLEYPSVIELKCQTNSEKTVVAYTKRETVNPPHKCFLVRWFQRRHKVTRIYIDEQNPYIINSNNMFIITED